MPRLLSRLQLGSHGVDDGLSLPPTRKLFATFRNVLVEQIGIVEHRGNLHFLRLLQDECQELMRIELVLSHRCRADAETQRKTHNLLLGQLIRRDRQPLGHRIANIARVGWRRWSW